MLRKFIAFAALPAILSCAPFQQASAAGDLTANEASLVDTACTTVMGLKPGEYYFANCQETLTQSLKRKHAAFGFARAADICRDRGLAEGSPALSVCMLDQERAGATQAAGINPQPVSLASSDDARQNGKSFYDVTSSVRWNRERYSCAQLGLTPNTGLFSQCVAGLEGAFLPGL